MGHNWNDWLPLMEDGTLVPFDRKVLVGVDDERMQAIRANLATGFVLSRIRFCGREAEVWLSIARESLKNFVKKEDVCLYVLQYVKEIPYKPDAIAPIKKLREQAISSLAKELNGLAEEKAEFLLLSIFALVSPFYDVSAKTFKNDEYSPLWRDSIRKLLRLLEKKACIANFERFRSFEVALFRLLPPVDKSSYVPTKDSSFLPALLTETYIMNPSRSIELSPSVCKMMFSDGVFKLLNLRLSRSPHALYCIAGFTSENENSEKGWTNLFENDPDEFVQAVIWPSGHVTIRLINEFENAEKRAKETGVKLAGLLAKRFECGQRCISLIGHSLGTVTIMECLKTLSRLEKQRGERSRYIIQDVLLMGGAAVIDEEKENLEEDYFDIVAGRVFNCYLDKFLGDVPLLLFGVLDFFRKTSPTKKPIGLREIKIESGLTGGRKKIKNIDVSGSVSGHTTYRENVGTVMKLCGFF